MIFHHMILLFISNFHFKLIKITKAIVFAFLIIIISCLSLIIINLLKNHVITEIIFTIQIIVKEN